MTEHSFFTDQSMIRRVHSEPAVALSGGRTLLMQAAHPVAFEGFFLSTGSLGDPYERLRRTARVMDTVTFGSRRSAERATDRVRAIHSEFSGELQEGVGPFPAGTSWRADDPELLLWILAALADSGMLVYDRYVTSMDRGARDAYWQDYRVVGELFGIPRSVSPATIEEFDDYMDAMLDSGELIVGDQARELALDIVMDPPVPPLAKPLLEMANFMTVGLLPKSIRDQYRFRWDPIRGIVLLGGATYAKRVLTPLIPRPIRRQAWKALQA